MQAEVISELIVKFFHGEFTPQVSPAWSQIDSLIQLGRAAAFLVTLASAAEREAGQGFKRYSGQWKGPP